jgi:hypothetical protein
MPEISGMGDWSNGDAGHGIARAGFVSMVLHYGK